MKPLPPRAGFAPFLVALVVLAQAPAACAAEAAAKPFKPDMARAQKLVTEICGACHTADGSRGAPANPILQGQYADYLVKQLTEFKAGKRKNPIMQGMAAPLSDDDVKSVAAFFAGKDAKPGFAKNKELVTLGERLYRGGNLGAKVPACAGCHSPTGAGVPSQYPRLSGQHAEYTEAQLTAFKSGARANSPQMAAIAAKMSEREIKAVADYIAGLR
ncbi:MAG: cytochrome c4 [Rubrivivax sp.]|nr:cytochrome c4 [Rubrivivax sp.]